MLRPMVNGYRGGNRVVRSAPNNYLFLRLESPKHAVLPQESHMMRFLSHVKQVFCVSQ